MIGRACGGGSRNNGGLRLLSEGGCGGLRTYWLLGRAHTEPSRAHIAVTLVRRSIIIASPCADAGSLPRDARYSTMVTWRDNSVE